MERVGFRGSFFTLVVKAAADLILSVGERLAGQFVDNDRAESANSSSA